MSAPPTTSELAFEAWCRAQGVTCRRIRESRIPDHKRPDYALYLRPHGCFVEIKELDETPEDVALLGQLHSGGAGFC